MPSFPAFKTKPYYGALSDFLAVSIDLATGELKDSAVDAKLQAALASEPNVVAAAESAAAVAVDDALATDPALAPLATPGADGEVLTVVAGVPGWAAVNALPGDGADDTTLSFHTLEPSWVDSGVIYADNYTSLEAAVTAAANRAGGGLAGSTVQLGHKIYEVDDTLKVPNKVAVVGANRQGSVIRASSSFPDNTTLAWLGRDGTDTFAFGTRIENLTLDCYYKPGSIGVQTTTAQEQSGLRNVVLLNFMDTGFIASGMTGGGAQHFHISDTEIYSSNTAINARGVYLEVIAIAKMDRVSVFNTNPAISKSNRNGLELNAAHLVGTELHIEHHDWGVKAYNTSTLSLDTVGGGFVTMLVEFTADCPRVVLQNIGVADPGGAGTPGGYVNDAGKGLWITDPVAFYASGAKTYTNGVNIQRTSSALAPSTADLPASGDYALHKDTATGNVYVAFNDGGTIKKVQLV